jgi:hypothetical protein
MSYRIRWRRTRGQHTGLHCTMATHLMPTLMVMVLMLWMVWGEDKGRTPLRFKMGLSSGRVQARLGYSVLHRSPLLSSYIVCHHYRALMSTAAVFDPAHETSSSHPRRFPTWCRPRRTIQSTAGRISQNSDMGRYPSSLSSSDPSSGSIPLILDPVPRAGHPPSSVDHVLSPRLRLPFRQTVRYSWSDKS